MATPPRLGRRSPSCWRRRRPCWRSTSPSSSATVPWSRSRSSSRGTRRRSTRCRSSRSASPRTSTGQPRSRALTRSRGCSRPSTGSIELARSRRPSRRRPPRRRRGRRRGRPPGQCSTFCCRASGGATSRRRRSRPTTPWSRWRVRSSSIASSSAADFRDAREKFPRLADCVRVVFLTLGVLGDERAAGATTARSYTSLAGDLRWYIQRIAAERSNIHIAIRVTLIRPRFRGSLDRARAPIL
mmetsp:Transcript_15133/g.48668  ORF Transcript_15133/g.48668 Transcript_15133/m.48668 type:complete len:242 (+) Transcript_15133:291-1016(+)